MAHKIRCLIAPLALVAALPLASRPAFATCMMPAAYATPTVVPALRPPVGWESSNAGVRPEGAVAIHDIAGFWKFTFRGTDGQVGDFGYIGMHDGGTETMVSFNRPPVTGDACMGVWQRQGPNHYKVSHYAPIFAPDNATFVGTVNIVEELRLAPDGESFTGGLATTGYDTSGNILFQAGGTIAATRVRVNTPAP